MGNDDTQRKHLESGIYRKCIFAAFFDATRARMKPNDCVREAIDAAVKTLLSNRSVELRGLDQQELFRTVWMRIRPNIQALHRVQDFSTRSKQLVALVTRLTADAALELWTEHVGG